jgi:hypothetical protein
MFDVEKAIAEWRLQMLSAGVDSAELLDELESHLRDAVEHQVRLGLDLQEAFETASREIGQSGILKQEFDKVGETEETVLERAKRALLSFAGIPSQYLETSMHTSFANLEPRWATYAKTVAFLAPAAWLWMASCTYVVPKFKQICETTDVMKSTGFWHLVRVDIGITNLVLDNAVLILPAGILALILLEWRWQNWPRYRRALFGFGAFLLNSLVLISLFIMFIAATWAGSVLLPHTR